MIIDLLKGFHVYDLVSLAFTSIDCIMPETHLSLLLVPGIFPLLHQTSGSIL